jgi:hypothetical protein
MVARERDRQRLLSTSLGTPRHTVKKTSVVDTLYVDLIERYAQAEGAERKDVVNLACHECFERRDYLPQHATEEGEPSSRRGGVLSGRGLRRCTNSHAVEDQSWSRRPSASSRRKSSW